MSTPRTPVACAAVSARAVVACTVVALPRMILPMATAAPALLETSMEEWITCPAVPTRLFPWLSMTFVVVRPACVVMAVPATRMSPSVPVTVLAAAVPMARLQDRAPVTSTPTMLFPVDPTTSLMLTESPSPSEMIPMQGVPPAPVMSALGW